MKACVALLSVVAAFVALPPIAESQTVAPDSVYSYDGARSAPQAVRGRPAGDDLPVLEIATRPSRTKYVWGGALIGVAIAVVGIVADDPEEDIGGAVVYPTIVAVSGLVGAGIGWVVYEIAH